MAGAARDPSLLPKKPPTALCLTAGGYFRLA
jgi:hypothetical protein